MTDTDNAARIIKELAAQAAHPDHLVPGSLYGYPTADGLQVVNLQDDKYLDEPRRKRGTVYTENVASFAQYYDKHADGDSEVFADVQNTLILAVLDAHTDGPPRWQDHRLVLKLAVTPEWAIWTQNDRKQVSQTAFAEFIEDHITDIAADGPCTGSDPA